MTAWPHELDALLDALRRERSLPVQERGTGAADASLDAVIALCAQAVTAGHAERDEASREALRRMARLAVDEWSLGAQLTAQVAEVASRAG